MDFSDSILILKPFYRHFADFLFSAYQKMSRKTPPQA